MTETPRLELVGIIKAYPGVIANNNVSLKIMPGEIHALLGENGAGKSTLVKFIYGVQKADAGRVLWEGEQVQIASPNAARKLGVGMVFQHFSLFDAMTVEENIAPRYFTGTDQGRPVDAYPRGIAAIRAAARSGPLRSYVVGRRTPADRGRALPVAGSAPADYG